MADLPLPQAVLGAAFTERPIGMGDAPRPVSGPRWRGDLRFFLLAWAAGFLAFVVFLA